MRFRRVVVALDMSSMATSMSAAVDLARSMEAELVGLFVEDIDLLSVAALPFAEVGFPSAARRSLDVDAMERSLRAKARLVHREFAARLAGDRLKWTFEVVRGRTVTALTTVAAEQDIAVVPLSSAIVSEPGARTRTVHAVDAAPVPLLLVSGAQRPDGAIAVVFAPGTPTQEVARIAALLAPHYGGSPLFVLAGAEAAQPEGWRHDLEERLRAQAIEGRFHDLAQVGASEIDRLLARQRPRLLLALAGSAEARDALVEALPLPLLVLPADEAARTPRSA